jgi:YggT family protein
VLVVAEAVYTATDPPLKFLGRFIPVLRFGSVALDLSFMLLFFVVLLLIQAVQLL